MRKLINSPSLMPHLPSNLLWAFTSRTRISFHVCWVKVKKISILANKPNTSNHFSTNPHQSSRISAQWYLRRFPVIAPHTLSVHYKAIFITTTIITTVCRPIKKFIVFFKWAATYWIAEMTSLCLGFSTGTQKCVFIQCLLVCWTH